MADGSFHELITSIRARLQSELDAQLPALTTRYEEAVSAARTATEADAEKKWSSILEQHKGEAQRQLEAAIAAARTEAPDTGALLEALRAIDSAATISDTLTSIAAAASNQSSHAALYVGPGLDAWQGARSADAPTALREALATGRTVRKASGGVAVPLLLDGTAVAVVEADPSSASERWAETIDLIVHYGAGRLAALTAVKVAQVQRWMQPAAAEPTPRPSEQEANSTADGSDEVQSAKRYARLLVSEIKLYNETAVHEGRAQRDLARRLAPEIERARRLYEERVSPTVVDPGRHFQHELIHTLAGGDPTLLG